MMDEQQYKIPHFHQELLAMKEDTNLIHNNRLVNSTLNWIAVVNDARVQLLKYEIYDTKYKKIKNIV
jgi:hypothetical protein